MIITIDKKADPITKALQYVCAGVSVVVTVLLFIPLSILRAAIVGIWAAYTFTESSI